MKKNIHPKYYPKTKATCVCGQTFTTGSTMPEIKTELCSFCHPFYTGKQKLVDSARRVEKFEARLKAKKEVAQTRKGKRVKRAARAVTKAKKEVTVKAEKAKAEKTKKPGKK